MRFMGGREFTELAGSDAVPCDIDDLQTIIAQGTFALPGFAGATGPFAWRTGEIQGPPPRDARQRYALATLYCALMSDYCLTALGADGDVVVEGSFTGNPWFAGLLAALRPGRQISNSDDSSGSTCGGWLLHYWGDAPASHTHSAAPLALAGWTDYKQQWLKVLL